ncbi:hypothetical protein TNIN_139141 [Trichonephila inaurata madagascariensis]|uniref:Uncharacterized protein n=1 Tax=Trichonephila inaurata madagascariensis TaxID=2747483 RepID=A0A8X6MFA6_9ARAC|nr:hypothetical protein TNIN_139141 [Trichonephila inaurata madagascariensis]
MFLGNVIPRSSFKRLHLEDTFGFKIAGVCSGLDFLQKTGLIPKHKLTKKSQKKRTGVSSVNISSSKTVWYLTRFSKYSRILKLVTWILRFGYNITTATERELTVGEIQIVEKKLLKRAARKVLMTQFSGAHKGCPRGPDPSQSP